MLTKVCSECRCEKPIDCFGRRTASRDGLRSHCKPCGVHRRSQFALSNPAHVKARQRAYYDRNREKLIARTRAWTTANPERYRANFLRSTRVASWHKFLAKQCASAAKRRGRDYDIDAEFLLELYERQAGKCFWLGVPFELSTESRGPARPSVDRLDIARGYTRDNVVLACQFANLGRSTLSAERFEAFLASTGLRR